MVWVVAGAGCKTDKPLWAWGKGHSVARTTKQLTVALEAPNPDRRRRALLSLLHEDAVRSPEAFKALDLIVRTDEDSCVRRAAIAVLAQYTDPRPVRTFLELLHCRDHPQRVRPIDDAIRLDVVTALGTFGDHSVIPADRQPDVVAALAELLRDSRDHQVCVQSARALRHFPSRRSVIALVGALAARDFGVAYEARASLRYLTGIQQEMTLAGWHQWLDSSSFGQPFRRPAAGPPSRPPGHERRDQP
jgi:HEAT repeat protein